MNEECARRAVGFVLRGLWERLSFGIILDDARFNTSIEQWFLLAARLDVALMNQSERDEVRNAHVLRWFFPLI